MHHTPLPSSSLSHPRWEGVPAKPGGEGSPAFFPSHPRAFTLTDLVALLAVVTLLCSFALVSLRENRRAASQSTSLANLRFFGAAYASYAADNNDGIATFTWRAGQSLSQFSDLNQANTDIDAAADQAVDIIRRRSPATAQPPARGFLPHVAFFHLVLIDYLGESAILPAAAAPGDANLRRYQQNPLNPCGQPGNPCPGSGTPLTAIASSYRRPAAFFARDRNERIAGVSINTVAPSPQGHAFFSVPQGSLINRRTAEIAFPALKVQLADAVARDFSPQRFMLETDARVPMLMSDASAAVRRTNDANSGVNPNDGSSALILYNPNIPFDPPAASPSPNPRFDGRFLWTSLGLRGIDYDAPRVRWTGL